MNEIADQNQWILKNRILHWIVFNEGVNEDKLFETFDIQKDELEQFLREFHDQGIEINKEEGVYIVKSIPDEFEQLKKEITQSEIEEGIIYQKVCLEAGERPSIPLKPFIEKNGDVLPMLKKLEDKGYLYLKDKTINLPKNILQQLNDEMLLQFNMVINIMKNTYPYSNKLHMIFGKSVRELEKRGIPFDKNAFIYLQKHRLSFLIESFVEEIEKAIYYKKIIEIQYMQKNGVKTYRLTPSGLVYTEEKDSWYLIYNESKRDHVFRLDRILKLDVLDEAGVQSSFHKEQYEKSIGISDEPPIEVEVVFDKESFIYKRLLRYKKQRKEAILKETNEGYYLKDNVNGISEFRRWVKGFGRSAKWLTPKDANKKLIEDLKLLRERMGEV